MAGTDRARDERAVDGRARDGRAVDNRGTPPEHAVAVETVEGSEPAAADPDAERPDFGADEDKTTFPHHIDMALELMRSQDYGLPAVLRLRDPSAEVVVEWIKAMPMPGRFKDVLYDLSQGNLAAGFRGGQPIDYVTGFRRFKWLLSGYQLGMAGKDSYAKAFFEDVANSTMPATARHPKVLLFSKFPSLDAFKAFWSQLRPTWAVMPHEAVGKTFKTPFIDTLEEDPNAADERAYEQGFKLLLGQLSIRWIDLNTGKAEWDQRKAEQEQPPPEEEKPVPAEFEAVIAGTENLGDSILVQYELPQVAKSPNPAAIGFRAAYREKGQWKQHPPAESDAFPTLQEAAAWLDARK